MTTGSEENKLNRPSAESGRENHDVGGVGATLAGDPVESALGPALRLVALILARHQIKNLKRLYDEFDHDIMLPLLLGEIALHNIGTPDARRMVGQANDAGGEDACVLKPCNAYSIAAATGMPRETVRRKIARLVELGWISRRHNGHLYISSSALQHFGRVLSSRELPELLALATRVRRKLQAAGETDWLDADKL